MNKLLARSVYYKNAILSKFGVAVHNTALSDIMSAIHSLPGI